MADTAAASSSRASAATRTSSPAPAWSSRRPLAPVPALHLPGRRRGPTPGSCPWLAAGTVITTPRHQVDVIVTEHGVAELQGRTVRQRARGPRRDRPPRLPRRPPRRRRASLRRAFAHPVGRSHRARSTIDGRSARTERSVRVHPGVGRSGRRPGRTLARGPLPSHLHQDRCGRRRRRRRRWHRPRRPGQPGPADVAPARRSAAEVPQHRARRGRDDGEPLGRPLPRLVGRSGGRALRRQHDAARAQDLRLRRRRRAELDGSPVQGPQPQPRRRPLPGGRPRRQRASRRVEHHRGRLRPSRQRHRPLRVELLPGRRPAGDRPHRARLHVLRPVLLLVDGQHVPQPVLHALGAGARSDQQRLPAPAGPGEPVRGPPAGTGRRSGTS